MKNELNGIAFNMASLLQDVNGYVSYRLLKSLFSNFVSDCADKDEMEIALFWASSHFNCSY